MTDTILDKIKELFFDNTKEREAIELGISIYPEHSTMEKDKAYLELAARYGYTKVFSCLLSVDDDVDRIKKKFTEINQFANNLGMEVTLDVSPLVFEKLNVQNNDLQVFKDMCANALRLDMGFGLEQDVLLTKNKQGLFIEMNASIVSGYIKELIEAGADVTKLRTCHNFYPQLYTGIGEKYFKDCTAEINETGVPVAAFISSNEPETFGPWPVKEGLPTLEIHRHSPVGYQARYMIATKMIGTVLFGNAYASEAELKEVADLNLVETTVAIKPIEGISKLEEEILYVDKHFFRGDASDMVNRDLISRFSHLKESLPANICPKTLESGDVVVINDNLAHYRGELQVVLQELENDGRYNLIGRVDTLEQKVVDYIDYSEIFQFVRENQ